MAENTELKDYGRLHKDGELRIKAHNDQKVKLRFVTCKTVIVFFKFSVLKNIKNMICTCEVYEF